MSDTYECVVSTYDSVTQALSYLLLMKYTENAKNVKTRNNLNKKTIYLHSEKWNGYNLKEISKSIFFKITIFF